WTSLPVLWEDRPGGALAAALRAGAERVDRHEPAARHACSPLYGRSYSRAQERQSSGEDRPRNSATSKGNTSAQNRRARAQDCRPQGTEASDRIAAHQCRCYGCGVTLPPGLQETRKTAAVQHRRDRYGVASPHQLFGAEIPVAQADEGHRGGGQETGCRVAKV